LPRSAGQDFSLVRLSDRIVGHENIRKRSSENGLEPLKLVKQSHGQTGNTGKKQTVRADIQEANEQGKPPSGTIKAAIPATNRPQLITSWASIVIALSGLLLSVYSACQSHSATRLSARPYVQIPFSFDDTGAGWRYLNMGLGVAVVKSFEVSLDGQRVRSWNELRDKLGLKGHLDFSVPGPGNIASPYKSGDRADLFWVSPDERNLLVSKSQRVRITSCYCSLYEECWKSSYATEMEIPNVIPEKVSACALLPANERFQVEFR
jgi:hypothetical protein